MTILFWFSIGVIFYVYLGYPLIVAILALLRPKPNFQSSNFPFITVLIAAFNEEEVIAQKIENILLSDYPKDKMQIIVSDDGSIDRTKEIAQSYLDQGVEVISDSNRRGKISAISDAMKIARGEIIVFSDANNIYYPDAIRALTIPFSDQKVGAVVGAKLVSGEEKALGLSEGIYWRYESFIKMTETRLGNCVAITGEVWAARRILVELPPTDIINEDFYMGMKIIRQGYRLVYTPRARSYKQISLSSAGEILRRTRITAGRYQILANSLRVLPFNNPIAIWQIISHKMLRLFLPFAMVAALVSDVWISLDVLKLQEISLDSLLPNIYVIILALQITFYLLGWLGNRTEKSKNKFQKILYLPSFLIKSNFASTSGLVSYLSRKQTNLWQRAPRETPTSIDLNDL